MSVDLSGATIAFDLDGTLVDSAPDLHRALNQVMAAEGLPPVTLEDMRRFIGQGARVLIMRASAAHGIVHDDTKLDRLTEEFTAVYALDIAAHTRPFPGVEAALDKLTRLGATLSVCTNKRTDLSIQLLDAVRLSHWFAAIVGADTVGRRKPHPDNFLTAVRLAGGNPAHAVMVGDSAADVGTARAAGAPVAIVSFGYTDTAPELLGADAVFGHFDELPDLAVRLLKSDQPTPLR
ncbi:MAG: phosphoglycolate phosphatase [Alphaproteobacteria bacterium]|nr:phosphoglycolate phosphatase [Alphaproteobacteria bacterium]